MIKKCENLKLERKNELINIIIKNEDLSNIYLTVLDNLHNNLEINDFTGQSYFNINKVINLILLLAKDGIQKTNLNKLLFYCDFVNFKNNSKSITGIKYKHLQYGPIPEDFEILYASLIKHNYLEYSEKFYPNGYIGEIYKSNKKPDITIFEDKEIKIIFSIIDKLKTKNAIELKDLSDKEKACKETNHNEYISYKYAKSIKINI